MTTTTPRKNLIQRMRTIYKEYPSQFWILVFGTFIDRLGGALLFPFFTLYMTRKFGIGMTQVGIIFGMFAVSSFFGSMVGGALTDRWGRKNIILFGLVMSATSSVLMGLTNSLSPFILVVFFVGILADVAAPAQQSLVADLLPEHQRAEGFGILRVVMNLAVTFGPVIGGFMAARSYLLLFVTDAITSIITAIILFIALKETKKPLAQGEVQESMGQTFRGYFTVTKDSVFMGFLAASVLSVIVYMQMNTTLGVYLRDVHAVSEQSYGYILSLNALMVVLFQFPITRRINRFRPLMVMAVGMLFYAVGYAMYGIFSWYGLFLLAMAIITVGEMLVSPVSQSIIANLAPEELRGRYMAVYGFSWLVPFAIGPLLAGLVMDNLNPDWVWYFAGILGVISGAGYYLLEWKAGRSRFQSVDDRLEIMARLEEGHITAEEAGKLIEGVRDGAWSKLQAPEAEREARRYVRIRVLNGENEFMKSDLRIPLGLVNAVLFAQGRLSHALEEYDFDALKDLIVKSTQNHTAQTMRSGDDHIEVSIE